MALQDFVYRLKPQSGDSAPHDEKGIAGNLSGGTITLVDLGSGDYAWQFAGIASAAGPSRTNTSDAAGSGFTMAIRIAIQAYDASSYAYLAGWGADATPARGLVLSQNGTNNVRARYVDTATDTVAMLAINNATRTIVLRATIANGSTDKVHVWVDGLTGSGDAADYTSTGQNYTISGDQTLDTIFCGSAGSTIRIADFVLWNEELSNADCHALVETGIRATLDGGASPHLVTIANSQQANAASTGSVSQSATTFVTGSNSTQTNTASAGAVTQPAGGTITLPALKDLGTGNVKTGETGVTIIINNATTGVLVSLLTGQTTNASGVLPTLTGLVSGTAYRITTILADGSEGTWKYTAA